MMSSPGASDTLSPEGPMGGDPRLRTRVCAVCGDSPAKVHYGVLACFGCKGFFRRAVKDGRNKYQCRYERNCPVNKYERNSCRYCRFRKCLQAGMNPEAVRPDRGDHGNESSAGKALPPPKLKLKASLSKKKSLARSASCAGGDCDDWTKLLGNDFRALLLDLMRLSKHITDLEGNNFEAVAGFNLKSLLADRTLALGNNYIPAQIPSTSTDTSFTAIWRVVSVVDWVDGLIRMFEAGRIKATISAEDKACLVQASFSQLTLLSLLVHVAAQPTLNDINAVRSLVENVKLQFPVRDLVQRLSSELVAPLRHAQLSETDFIVIKAIIALNPDCPGLCTSAVARLREIRATLFDLLIKSIKRSRPKTTISPSALFGQLLSLLPSLKHISGDIATHLAEEYPRPCNSSPTSRPSFQSILTDIFSPEGNDLVLEAVMEKKASSVGSLSEQENAPTYPAPSTGSSMAPVQPPPQMPLLVCPPPISLPGGFHDIKSMQFPQLSPISSSSLLSPPYSGMPQRSNSNFGYPCFPPPPQFMGMSAFSAPSPGGFSLSGAPSPSNFARPNTLTFSPKLPLQLTRSIEEILRPAGMAEDPLINRPLASDWAETAGISTPIFNRDVVAQFFPEMAGQMS